jgi:hypothetical protein
MRLEECGQTGNITGGLAIFPEKFASRRSSLIMLTFK